MTVPTVNMVFKEQNILTESNVITTTTAPIAPPKKSEEQSTLG